jgi:hypothetical protein
MPSRRLYQTSISATLLVVSGTLLQGCAGKTEFATLKPAGEAFPQAQYQVLGKTRYDQTWIDKTTEAELVGFGFKRPQKRPASFDAAPASHTVVVLPPSKPAFLTPATPPVVTVVPKKHWWQRLKKAK